MIGVVAIFRASTVQSKTRRAILNAILVLLSISLLLIAVGALFVISPSLSYCLCLHLLINMFKAPEMLRFQQPQAVQFSNRRLYLEPRVSGRASACPAKSPGLCPQGPFPPAPPCEWFTSITLCGYGLMDKPSVSRRSPQLKSQLATTNEPLKYVAIRRIIIQLVSSLPTSITT